MLVGPKEKGENAIVLAPREDAIFSIVWHYIIPLCDGQTVAVGVAEDSARGAMYYIFVAGTLALTAFIGYTTFATAMLMRRWRLTTNPLLSKADAVVRLMLIGVCIGLGAISGLDAVTLGWTLENPLQQILLGGAIGLGLGLGLHGLSQWVLKNMGTRLYSKTFSEMIVPHTQRDFYLIAGALVFVVILEELLFRSLLIGGFSPLLPVWLLVIFTSLVFGALHLPQGAWGIVGATIAGAIFGVLFLYEHSLLTPIVAHYVANMIQIMLVFRLLDAPAKAAPEQTSSPG